MRVLFTVNRSSVRLKQFTDLESISFLAGLRFNTMKLRNPAKLLPEFKRIIKVHHQSLRNGLFGLQTSRKGLNSLVHSDQVWPGLAWSGLIWSDLVWSKLI